MKSFTQRWREASDEAEDQPMEDTPTDPKEAPVIAHTDYKAIASGLQRVNAALESALAAQTDRADRLQAEVEEYRQDEETRLASDPTEVLLRESQARELEWIGRLNVSEDALYSVQKERDRLTAELDAVRKERDEFESECSRHSAYCFQAAAKISNLEVDVSSLRKDCSVWNKLHSLAIKQRDAAQAKCAELERALATLKPLITAAGVAVCKCGIKNVRSQFHDHDCFARDAAEALANIEKLLMANQQAITNPSEAEMLNAEKLQFGQPLPAPPEEKRP